MTKTSRKKNILRTKRASKVKRKVKRKKVFFIIFKELSFIKEIVPKFFIIGLCNSLANSLANSLFGATVTDPPKVFLSKHL